MTPRTTLARTLLLPTLLWTLLLCGAACTPYKHSTEAPVAMAGEDLMLSGDSVEVTLDGSDSYDPDGEIFAYEWRYTGWPVGFMPSAVDGGMLPTNPTTDPLAQPPSFCTDAEYIPDSPVQLRYCLVAKTAKHTLTLPPGGYRFTLFVEDDDGKIGGDTVEVTIAP